MPASYEELEVNSPRDTEEVNVRDEIFSLEAERY